MCDPPSGVQCPGMKYALFSQLVLELPVNTVKRFM